MNFTLLTAYAFAVVSALYILHFGFYLIGANVYDVWQARRQHDRYHAAATGRAKRYEPLVTIAISAHNEELVIVRCLESIRNSSYKHLQILLADDGSVDLTYKLIEDYAKAYPDFPLTFFKMPRKGGKGNALNHALKTHGKGELAMTLDADSVLHVDAIANAVSYFTDPTIVGVAANVKIMDDYTVLGVLQRLEHLVGYRSKKVYSITNCEFVVGGVASTYRMNKIREYGFYDTDTFTEDIGLSMKVVSHGNRSNRIVYASDVVAQTEGVTTFHGLLRQRYRWKYGSLQNLIKYRRLMLERDTKTYSPWLVYYRMPMAIASEFALLLAPIIWAYILYWTLAAASLRLMVGAYIVITLYTLMTIWFDEHMDKRDRIHLSLYAFTAYFIFYIMDTIQLISMFRCLRRGYRLVRQKNDGAIWVSPARIGREIAAG
jgi:cellulose synthase/poly-beta-1,6-N-acetylglucosamine synthase-like glycosyltransferase